MLDIVEVAWMADYWELIKVGERGCAEATWWVVQWVYTREKDPVVWMAHKKVESSE